MVIPYSLRRDSKPSAEPDRALLTSNAVFLMSVLRPAARLATRGRTISDLCLKLSRMAVALTMPSTSNGVLAANPWAKAKLLFASSTVPLKVTSLACSCS